MSAGELFTVIRSNYIPIHIHMYDKFVYLPLNCVLFVHSAVRSHVQFHIECIVVKKSVLITTNLLI